MLILTHVGARTGTLRRNPLTFLNHDNGFLVVASKNASPTNPDWLYNLKANPEATALVDGHEIPVTAEIPTAGPERDQLFDLFSQALPRFARYQQKTKRTLPVVRLIRRI